VQALVVTPGSAGSARIDDVRAPQPTVGHVLLRPLEIGVCGTDAEIAHGLFGIPPDGENDLVLGHELLGEVVEGAGPFAAGDLVASTVRRSCGLCIACEAGSPDACLTGRYHERGITRLHGFASEVILEAPEHLIPIPQELGRFGVLAEPGSVTSRALRHIRAVGDRQIWEPTRALVLGAGAVGVLATFFLRLEGYDVWSASLEAADSDKARLLELSGAHYVSTGATRLEELGHETGGFDIVVEATGNADVAAAAAGLLRRNGVACLLGLDARPGSVEIPRQTLTVDLVIQNRAVIGSVNAHPGDWHDAVARLVAIKERWPEAAERVVGLRVPPDRFQEAFDFRGGKATLQFA
jgi:glucose 1-dehydrogenase